jgi:hypothetical protein
MKTILILIIIAIIGRANATDTTYTVTVSANPLAGGSVCGDGTYYIRSEAPFKATPAQGYIFINWTEGKTVISNIPGDYIRSLTTNRNLVANFTKDMPVTLVNFSVQVYKNKVTLSWNTATEVMNYGFDIEKFSPVAGWTKIGFVPGHGTISTPHNYSFIDIPKPGQWLYRLKQIDTDGNFVYSKADTARVFIGQILNNK